MDDWEFADFWELAGEEDYEEILFELAFELADSFFLSDSDYLPNDGEDYSLGYLSAEDWWPLVNQLDELVDLQIIVGLAKDADSLLRLPGLPTELLEAPRAFLLTVLDGNLPPEPSGRQASSRRLVEIAQVVVRLLGEFPDTAQAAVRAWADVHRKMMAPPVFDEYEGLDLDDLLAPSDLPPAMTGFSMMIALTLMHWPGRAEGLPLPSDFADPELYDEVLAQWEALPDSLTVTEEGLGVAEAFFAQGQLAHTMAQMGTVELMAAEGIEEENIAVVYSRLSRAILWVHNQCRNCPEREGVTCRVAASWPERPVPLLDIASEIANTGRIAGCINTG